MSRTFGYVRVSTLDQQRGDGPHRQARAITARCRALRAPQAATFVDLGVSGTLPLDARPGLRGALQALQAGDVLVAERADRLGRDLIESELALRRFAAAGVRVLDAAGTDLTAGDGADPTAVLIRQVLGAVAEHDRRALLARLRAGRSRIRHQCGGVPPFGARPGEAEVVDLIRSLSRRRCPVTGARWSAGKVAAELARRGVPTRSGKPWSRATVRDVLQRSRSGR